MSVRIDDTGRVPSATEHHVRRQSIGSGHVYQGRFKSFPVKDKGDDRNLSRYVHFNPSKGNKPPADSPELCPYSSYAEYEHDGKTGSTTTSITDTGRREIGVIRSSRIVRS